MAQPRYPVINEKVDVMLVALRMVLFMEFTAFAGMEDGDMLGTAADAAGRIFRQDFGRAAVRCRDKDEQACIDGKQYMTEMPYSLQVHV